MLSDAEGAQLRTWAETAPPESLPEAYVLVLLDERDALRTQNARFLKVLTYYDDRVRRAVAAEREACARLGEAAHGSGAHTSVHRAIAAAIRDRARDA